MSQRKSNRPNTENVELNVREAATACVRYLICREGSKIPIKRGDVMKYLSNICQFPTNQANAVITEANGILKNIYGYKLVQVQGKSGIQYIMVLQDECDSPASTATNTYHRRLLNAALIHIYMTGCAVKEDDMWKFLSETGLLEENNYAGRKILTNTFTKQMYLTYNKVGEGDLARNVFEWGQRASEEIPKRFLLQKMSEAFEKSPDYWYEQFKEANQNTET